MQNSRKKKVIFLTSDSPLLTLFARECETEVISSISFLQSFTERWIPDYLIGGISTIPQIRQIRQALNLSKTPLILIHRDFSETDIPEDFFTERNTMIANECVAREESYISHILKTSNKKASLKAECFVKRAILQINRDMTTHCRSSISEKIGISEDYLSRIFRKETGIRLWDYLNMIRLERAKDLAETTSLPLSEIAERCGFTDDSHLSNSFRKRFGYPPGQLRKV